MLKSRIFRYELPVDFLSNGQIPAGGVGAYSAPLPMENRINRFWMLTLGALVHGVEQLDVRGGERVCGRLQVAPRVARAHSRPPAHRESPVPTMMIALEGCPD